MKNKWTSFFSGIAASSVMVGTLVAANKMAKKYGQRPNQDKLINVNPTTLIDYGIKKFLETDDEKLAKITELINSKK